MATATTASYDKLVLEVELDPVGDADTYTKICGIMGVTVTRTANTETSEVPDCDDESAPFDVRREVRSLEVTASGSGVWARESDQAMKTWFYGGASLNARLRNVDVEDNGATGDIYAEQGPALLVSLSNERQKGAQVTAEIELQFDGTPARETLSA